jgi:hypothetical protein
MIFSTLSFPQSQLESHFSNWTASFHKKGYFEISVKQKVLSGSICRCLFERVLDLVGEGVMYYAKMFPFPPGFKLIISLGIILATNEHHKVTFNCQSHLLQLVPHSDKAQKENDHYTRTSKNNKPLLSSPPWQSPSKNSQNKSSSREQFKKKKRNTLTLFISPIIRQTCFFMLVGFGFYFFQYFQGFSSSWRCSFSLIFSLFAIETQLCLAKGFVEKNFF